MATPTEKLAASLGRLHELQRSGRQVFRSRELTRVHRERLLKNGFLQEVMKGWLISAAPDADPGDTTPWFASYWEFCARYCEKRFGDQWHLSPEQSLLLHGENTVIPQQLVIYTPKGANNTVELLFGTSLYDLKEKRMPPEGDLTQRRGLRLYSVAAALTKVPDAFFARYQVESRVALSGIPDTSELLARLLEGGHTAAAGRLAGAFRRVRRTDVADDMLSAMKGAGYDVRESDPFAARRDFAAVEAHPAPIVGRLQAMWESYRDPVLEVFPEAPGLPADREAYLRFIDDVYRSDAYHSLSIEGYSVTNRLIDRVRSGQWDPDKREADRRSRDALAARGYWEAFQLVKQTVAQVIAGGNAGALVEAGHREWYRELFQPSVRAGLIAPSALAGYRSHAVFLRGSRHVPPRQEAVRDAMPAFTDLLESEPTPAVAAVLGHWMFGYVHPYPDGNGRLARFLMNVMLASGGYPWTVIRVDDREAYLAALDAASTESDIRPFARFVADRVRWSLERAA